MGLTFTFNDETNLQVVEHLEIVPRSDPRKLPRKRSAGRLFSSL